MNSNWPNSGMDSIHSIQHVQMDDSPDQSQEITPLLPYDETPCMRNLWIVFLAVFLLIGFVVGAYLLMTEESEWPVSENYEYSLKTRKQWQAKNINSSIPKLHVPVEKVLLTKTDSPECIKNDCSREIHNIQKDHLHRLQEPDIGYNFLIGGDGQTYEGRGWNYQAMIVNRNDNRTLVIAFLGIFNDTRPSKRQMDQAKSFLRVSENLGRLKPCYLITGEEHLNDLFMEAVLFLQGYFKNRHKEC